MRRLVPNFARLLLLGMAVQQAAAGPLPQHQASPQPRDTTTVRVTRVVPASFSIENGSLRAKIDGVISGAEPANLFLTSDIGARTKLSPGRLIGSFTLETPNGINNFVDDWRMTFFASPSEDGSHKPSAPFVFRPDIVIPAPTIISAVGGRKTARISGKALRGARIQVSLAGTSKTVTASGHGSNEGDWRASFTDVPAGEHTVAARTVDITGKFAPSANTVAHVKAEGDITQPLHVRSPQPDSLVKRTFNVYGEASPKRGNVQISVGGGPVVETPVRINQTFTAQVRSASHGDVPLVVTLPGTGESIRYNIKVAPFGDPVVSRFVRDVDPVNGRTTTLIAEGTVSLDGLDTEVRYLTKASTLETLAPIDEEGHWRYEGEIPSAMLLRTERIDGLFYNDVASLNVPSQGNGEPDSVVPAPMLKAGPELTSPTRVGVHATLTGFDRSASRRDVKITTADGQTFLAPVHNDRSWTAVIGPLPLGRMRVELKNASPEAHAHLYEATSYVLDVVESP